MSHQTREPPREAKSFASHTQKATESTECVNPCVKEFRKVGWDFWFRVIEPYVRLAQPIETKRCIGCGGWI